MTTIRVYSGKEFSLTEPTVAQFDIRDVAHALAGIYRWGAQSPVRFSVAQHCVIVMGLVPVSLQWEALMHDYLEAYLGDIPLPTKALLPDWQALEARLHAVGRQAFGLPETVSPLVHEMDQECRISWEERIVWDPRKAWVAWSPERAETEFLARVQSVRPTCYPASRIIEPQI